MVLDIGLPDIDGYQVLRRIREFSDVPVVMLTGRNRPSDIDLFLKEGALADDYILKPFGKTDLITRIGNVLEAHGLATGRDVNTTHVEVGDDLYEGTVWLEIRGETSEGPVAKMLQQIRQQPELRLLRLTHRQRGGVRVMLGLRRPVRLAAIIGGMVGVNEVVPKVDPEETAADRELTVTLDAVVPAGPKIQ
jgi:DNA-binding NarL/FixJ family response regulator